MKVWESHLPLPQPLENQRNWQPGPPRFPAHNMCLAAPSVSVELAMNSELRPPAAGGARETKDSRPRFAVRVQSVLVSLVLPRNRTILRGSGIEYLEFGLSADYGRPFAYHLAGWNDS